MPDLFAEPLRATAAARWPAAAAVDGCYVAELVGRRWSRPSRHPRAWLDGFELE
jgi:hypothetical protein